MLATPLSWLLALDRWLCVPAFRRVCPSSSKQYAEEGAPKQARQAPNEWQGGTKTAAGPFCQRAAREQPAHFEARHRSRGRSGRARELLERLARGASCAARSR